MVTQQRNLFACYQRETWEGPCRRFRWNAFPRLYSSANWINFWADGTT